MDVKNLELLVASDEEGVVITIYQKNGDPYLAKDGTDSTMTVVGSESKKIKAAKRGMTKRMLKRRRVTLDEMEVERNQIEMAAAAVIDWHGWEKGDKTLECTSENVRYVLTIDHIREQVEQGRDAHADFSLASSAT